MRLTEQVYGDRLGERVRFRINRFNGTFQTKLGSCRAGGLINTSHRDIGEQISEVVEVEHLREIINSRSIWKHNTVDSAAAEQRGNAGELLPGSRYRAVSCDDVDTRAGFFQESGQAIPRDCSSGNQNVESAQAGWPACKFFQGVGYLIRSFLFTN